MRQLQIFPLAVALLATIWSADAFLCEELFCHCTGMGEAICQNCEAPFVLRSNSTRHNFGIVRITIKNCPKVKLQPRSVLNTVHTIELSNIEELELDEDSLGHVQGPSSYEGLKVKIENCGLKSIRSHVFKGVVNSVVLLKSRISSIDAYAFGNLHKTRFIDIIDTRIERVEFQAFKKFDLDMLRLINCNIGTLNSRSFSDINVTEKFVIEGCKIEHIHSGAFTLNNPNDMLVTSSHFGTIESGAFQVSVNGHVHFKSNYMRDAKPGAFSALRAGDFYTGNLLKLIFHNATFANNFTTGILRYNTSSFQRTLDGILVDTKCTCSSAAAWLDGLNPYDEVMCLRQGEVRINVREYKETTCRLMAGYTDIILISSISGVLLLCALLVIVYIVCFRSRKGRKGKGSDGKRGSYGLVVPDGRTYRETELHVIVEKSGLLRTDL